MTAVAWGMVGPCCLVSVRFLRKFRNNPLVAVSSFEAHIAFCIVSLVLLLSILYNLLFYWLCLFVTDLARKSVYLQLFPILF